ncbi:uncharacterized protein BDV14DRAFT_170093 [Aspergillus stella-maris]|uniref:uncharacterized protein n=1 Tax=Aspergillus stella-maris TaxID=1810926 RepID=UPI003CCDF2F4
MPSTESDFYIGSTASGEWALVLKDANCSHCTVYTTRDKSTGCHTVPTFNHVRLDNQIFESLDFESERMICTVAAVDEKVLNKAAAKIEPSTSQLYVVAVLARLEKKGVVLKGTSKLYAKQVSSVVKPLDAESRLVRMCVADTSMLSMYLA